MSVKRIAPMVAAAALLLCAALPALAQARNPFGVGISEGGGGTTGFTGWILAQQGWFEHQLSALVRAAKADGSALWTLVGVSLVYGVFHAAGPGHGKAVLASYMVANERALRRGIVLSFLAALLQGLVAVTLVGVLSLILHATAQRMKDAAHLIEIGSFAGIACLGLWLVWRKGRSFLACLRLRPALVAEPSFAGVGQAFDGLAGPNPMRGLAFEPAQPGSGRFVCLPGDVTHVETCAHCGGVDPATLDAPGFSWRDACLTVVAAGSRPCSGAILVLVFAAVQGMFGAGVLAVVAMSLGVAVTTAALASLAVLAKGVAQRLTRRGSWAGGALIAGLEFGAAVLVLAVGVGLLLGVTAAGA